MIPECVETYFVLTPSVNSWTRDWTERTPYHMLSSSFMKSLELTPQISIVTKLGVVLQVSSHEFGSQNVFCWYVLPTFGWTFLLTVHFLLGDAASAGKMSIYASENSFTADVHNHSKTDNAFHGL